MAISTIQKRPLLYLIFLVSTFISCVSVHSGRQKPTLCILGGTPSTTHILNLIPDSIRSAYNLISFNRPGFGGSANRQMSEELLYKLAREAGLKKNDFGIIGVSGGAPLAISIAKKFHLKHCGVISGMVSKKAFFKYGDKAVTKGIMETALGDYAHFKTTTMQFPNLDEIVKEAGAKSKEVALRACYDELSFILSDKLFPASKADPLQIHWWHGEEDINVPIESVELFLKDYPNARLNKIAKATHGMDGNLYISKLLKQWQ